MTETVGVFAGPAGDKLDGLPVCPPTELHLPLGEVVGQLVRLLRLRRFLFVPQQQPRAFTGQRGAAVLVAKVPVPGAGVEQFLFWNCRGTLGRSVTLK